MVVKSFRTMRKSEDILFNLLRCELWGDKFDLDVTPQEIGEVLKVAKAQTVFGLVFNALVANQVKYDKKVLFKAIAIQNKIRQQNELINQEMVDFFKQMEEATQMNERYNALQKEFSELKDSIAKISNRPELKKECEDLIQKQKNNGSI